MQNYKNEANSNYIMNKLKHYRKKIDLIDRNIVKLLLSRFKLIKRVANYKKINKIQISDEIRELEVLKNIEKHSKKDHSDFIKNIFKSIINYSKKFQSK